MNGRGLCLSASEREEVDGSYESSNEQSESTKRKVFLDIPRNYQLLKDCETRTVFFSLCLMADFDCRC
jgi:hypothetical protein